jgi:acyl-CoA-binding protein
VAVTKRAPYEELNSDFQQTHDEFRALEKTIDEKFGDVAPDLSVCRTALSEIQAEITAILEKKRQEEPDPPAAAVILDPGRSVMESANAGVTGLPVSSDSHGGPWNEAEMLIRSGQVEKGLAQMVQLATTESCGRNRFQRKLMLAEACLASKRERLARNILEELAEQIDSLKLEMWESSELVASVWIRLYKLYKQGSDGSDHDRAAKLYDRLCRLDPWQALNCGEG